MDNPQSHMPDRNIGGSAPIVELTVGSLRGTAADGVRRFLGVPYAAPPVGERRFRAPEPVPAWRGVRDATAPGPNAPQRVRQMPGLATEPLVGRGWEEGDDYLTLNVWRPDREESSLPVMVFVHGGGFVLGSKDAAVQDGTAFARDGIVLVSINYRLGIEGFLPIPGVPTNLGLRDILFALAWVRDNIAAFGGDPEQVTVFGESAGAMAVADLVTSPLARGLFRRAIVQSGHGAMTREIPVAQRLVRKLARLLGVRPDAAGFASVAPGDALDALEKVSLPTTRLDLRGPDGREPVFGISRFVPVHGDDVLPVPPLEALRAGAGADVELLIGSNAEEMNLYLVPSGVRDKVGALLATWLLHRSQPRAWRVLRAYGLRGGRTAGEALNDAMTDLVFRWPARRYAEEHRGLTHVYDFDWRSPRYDGRLGAAHAMELPFVFDTLASVTGPEGLCGEAPPQALATRLHRLWVGFGKGEGLPWPPFDRDGRQVYSPVADRAQHEEPMMTAAFLP